MTENVTGPAFSKTIFPVMLENNICISLGKFLNLTKPGLFLSYIAGGTLAPLSKTFCSCSNVMKIGAIVG